MKKKLLTMVCVGAMIASLSAFGAAASDEELVFGISTLDMSNEFFVSVVNGAQDACDELGVTLLTNDSKGSAETQLSAVENFVSSGCQAIVIAAVDPDSLSSIFEECNEKGIKIVSMFEQPEADLTLSQDPTVCGRTLGEAAGKWITENLGDQEKVEAAILNYDRLETVIERREGIEAGLLENAPNVEIVASVEANETAPGLDATESLLQAHPDLQCVLGINDSGALGAYEAFKAAGVDEDKVIIGGIDATGSALEKIAEGGMYRITVDQQPYQIGYDMVVQALNLVQGKDTDDVMPRYKAVTKENVSEFGY